MECQCGKYAVELARRPDDTKIYYCYECRRLWGERLVQFDVDFSLVEHQQEAYQPSKVEAVSIPVLSGDGLGQPGNGATSV